MATPTVTALSRHTGSILGGTFVIVTGTGFTTATAVKFKTTNAASFTIDSATQITAVSPSHSAEQVHLTVVNPDGTSPTTGADLYEFGVSGNAALAVDNSLWKIAVGSDAKGWRDITAESTLPTLAHQHPGGALSASFSTRVSGRGGYNELAPDQEVEITYAGQPAFSGYILPRPVSYQDGELGRARMLDIECAGPAERLKRRGDFAWVYSDADLDQWYGAEWDTLTPGIQVSQQGVLKFAAASGSVFPANSFQEVWYWLHRGLSTEQGIYSIEFIWSSLGTMTWQVFEAATPAITSSWAALGTAGGGSTHSSPSAVYLTCSAGTRALAIRVGWAGGKTLTYNEWVKFGLLRVNGQAGDISIGTALESILVAPGLADSYYSVSLPSSGSSAGGVVEPPPPDPPPEYPYGEPDYFQETFNSYTLPDGMYGKVFQECTFQGGAPGEGDYSGVLSLLNSNHDIVFYNCTIKSGPETNGVKMVDYGRTLYNIIFDDCTFEEQYRFGFECISRPPSGTLCYSGVQLLNCTFDQQGGESISFDGQKDSTGCVIHNCVCNGSGMEPDMQAIGGFGSCVEVNGPHNFTITGNTFRRAYHGIVNFQQNDGDTTDCGWVFTGNLVDGDDEGYGPATLNGSDLIGCNKVRGGNFTGNTIKNHAEYSTHAIAATDCHDMDWSPNTWSDDRGVPDYAPNAWESGCSGNTYG